MPPGHLMDLSRFYLAYLVIMSVAAFLIYHQDKANARKGRFRTRERTLLGLSLAGGAYGGLLAMVLFRHKTRKPHFWVVQLVGAALHMLLYLVIS